jgi:hypothetical protein
MILALLAVEARAQNTVREVLGGSFDFTFDPDNPIIEMPLPKELEDLLIENVIKPTPMEEKLMECFGEVGATIAVTKVMYGSEPAPALPDNGAVCRLNAVAAALQSVQPPPQPPPLSVSEAVDGVGDGDLRERIAQAVVAASAHASHLGLLRRQIERLASMSAASAELRRKAGLFVPHPPAKWPEWRWILFSETRCAAGDAASTESARAEVAAQWEPFLMQPHLAAILGGVSVSTGHLLPIEVALCDSGTKLRQCVAAAGDDPWNSGCWSETTETIADLPCLLSWPSREQLRRMDWTGCPGDFQALLAPYVAMKKSAAESLAAHPAFVPPVIEPLVRALDAVDPVVAGTSTRHRAARSSRTDSLRPPASSLGRLLSEEKARLTTERQRLDVERSALSQLFAVVQTLQSEMLALESKKTALAARTAAARAKQVSLRQQADALRTRGDQLRDGISASTEATANVTLACGGLSYADCLDEAAKRDYDRRVYEAHQLTVKLMEELFTASDVLSATYSDLLAAQQDEMMATAESAPLGFDLSVKQAEWHDRSREHQRRAAQHQVDETVWKARLTDHASDATTLERVVHELDRDPTVARR